MRTVTILLLAATTCLYACATPSSERSAAPAPFECTSIHPEVCELEERFHRIRIEQAEQNAAIEAAERRRQEQERATASAAARPEFVPSPLLDAPAG